ncbi:MAG: ComF family protein [Rhodospirillales bacterium]
MLLPPQCLGCRAAVDADDVLCPRCWIGIDFIARPMCDTCGLPFDHEQHSPVCAQCIRETPPFHRARSAVRYNDESRRLIIAYKHADRMEAAGLFARWMLTAGVDLVLDADVIVPVPLHRRRLFSRRFNQAALIAQLLGRETDIPVDVESLIRVKPSPPPGRSTPGERRRAVAGAFRIDDGAAGAFAGRRVLVVDDVMTTGATAKAIAGRLNRAGAAAVDVLTIARVVRD